LRAPLQSRKSCFGNVVICKMKASFYIIRYILTISSPSAPIRHSLLTPATHHTAHWLHPLTTPHCSPLCFFYSHPTAFFYPTSRCSAHKMRPHLWAGKREQPGIQKNQLALSLFTPPLHFSAIYPRPLQNRHMGKWRRFYIWRTRQYNAAQGLLNRAKPGYKHA